MSALTFAHVVWRWRTTPFGPTPLRKTAGKMRQLASPNPLWKVRQWVSLTVSYIVVLGSCLKHRAKLIIAKVKPFVCTLLFSSDTAIITSWMWQRLGAGSWSSWLAATFFFLCSLFVFTQTHTHTPYTHTHTHHTHHAYTHTHHAYTHTHHAHTHTHRPYLGVEPSRCRVSGHRDGDLGIWGRRRPKLRPIDCW